MELELVPVESAEQIAVWLAMRSRAPGEPLTPETYERLRAMAGDTLDIVAEVSGEPAGVGYAGAVIGEPEGPDANVWAFVLPERRRRGIGSAIFGALSAHAAGLGKARLRVPVAADDPDGLRFLRARGFELYTRERMTVLDLGSAAEADVESPIGVEIVSLAERPDAVRGMYEVALEALPDVPGEHVTVGSFESWRRDELEQTFVIEELSFVALLAGDVVAYATLGDYGDGQGLHLMTGVRRATRGRGLAEALKRTQIAAARSAGLRRLIAFNNDANEPIKRLNDALGYVPQQPISVLRGPLV